MRRLLSNSISLITILLALVAITPANAGEPLTVAWTSRPPLQYLVNGIEKGKRLLKVKAIFSKANIASQFVEEPSKRIWNHLSSNRKNYCSFDWYKTPEREDLVQYSTYLEEIPPYSILYNQLNAQKIKQHTSINALLADSTLQLGLIDSASYGVELEAMIKKGKNKVTRYNISPMILARMINANRASYMFISSEEWEYLKENDIYLQDARLIDIAGVPSGLKSYIVCSKDVAPEIMKKINDAIESSRLISSSKSHSSAIN